MHLDTSNFSSTSVPSVLSVSALSPDDDSFLVDLTINTSVNLSCSFALKGFLDCGATGEFMHQNTAEMCSIVTTGDKQEYYLM